MSIVLEKDIDKLVEIINSTDNIVAITGAGVSTESNIPDFRSDNGLYNQESLQFSPEEILSLDYFRKDPLSFYKYYLNTFMHLNKEPNITHKFLADLEKLDKLKMIITQNVDGLHQKAGNKNIIEIHGTIYKNNCISCGREYSVDYIKQNQFCECGSIIKPNVLLYGEGYNRHDFLLAHKVITTADVLMILGTSLQIQGILDLIKAYQKNKIVILNREEVELGHYENVFGCEMIYIEKEPLLGIYGELGEILSNVELNCNSLRKIMK